MSLVSSCFTIVIIFVTITSFGQINQCMHCVYVHRGGYSAQLSTPVKYSTTIVGIINYNACVSALYILF